ncbi:MAG: prepilin peptidase [Desulfonatronovibrionaceae bacterium]
MQSYFVFGAAVLGLCLGSFFNVCIHRFLNGESIVLPASHCPECGHALSWWENIPVLSYVLLRGRCRSCRAGIRPRYMAVEIVSGATAVLLALKFGFSWSWLVYFALAGVLIVASFIDLEAYILPDFLTLPGAVLALAASFFLPIFWLDALIGAIAGFALFWGLQYTYKLIKGQEGLGSGDVKLMLMLGALVGWKGLPLTIFLASCLGLIASLYYLYRDRYKGMQTKIPFGPFLALGAYAYLLCGEEIVGWYLGSF